MTQDEHDLRAAIDKAKDERRAAKDRGDLEAFSELCTQIGDMSAQVWRVRLQPGLSAQWLQPNPQC
jgi:hypothetical protein